jgi:hypothetical protein
MTKIVKVQLRLCLRVWRGREGKERLKRKKQVERLTSLGGKEFGGLIFLPNTKTPQFGGTQKLYWMRVWRGFGGFI